jgi:diguanylate cyclase (GGDEF)-like protein/PAS domain S-box-containing protein
LAAGLTSSYADVAAKGQRHADICRVLLFLASLALLTYAGHAFWRLREGSGRLHKALAIMESQKLALDAHAQQLRIAANALENTVEGIMITDAQRRIVSVNKSFTDITGYTAGESIGRAAIFLRADHDAAFHDDLWEVVRKAGHWRGEVKRRRKDGRVYPQFNSISSVRNPAGETTHYVTVFSDISLDKENAARLEFLAHYDALTHLPNRTLFQDRLREALYRARRYGHPVALMFIDLDRFKSVNDTLGHEVGDLLLQATARRLEQCVRETDTVARLGGDEFTILLHELVEGADAVTVAEKVLASLAQPFVLAGRELCISASIGITCYPDDGEDAQILLANADAAMYCAKQRGRNTHHVFAAGMDTHAADNLVLAQELRKGLDHGELVLHYEPRVALVSGKITAVEALVRWQHPRLGLLAPARFMAVAEESGLIEAIGEWVMNTACVQMRAWQVRGIAPARIAVNLLARQFAQPDLPQRIVACLTKAGIGGDRLEIEITEGMAMQDPDRARETLVQLRALGITASIDNFGTGHSSLGHLERLPIDYFKIDKSFVNSIAGDSDDAAIVRTIIAMARGLKLRAIATGVETARQCGFLRREGCEEMQGPLFGGPGAVEEVEALLAGRVLVDADVIQLPRPAPLPPQLISSAAATLLPSAVRML